jgi:geranylgeranyl diphosphate synthase type II
MIPYKEQYDALRQMVNDRLAALELHQQPETISAPARYVLAGGGKRIRPVLVLLGCKAVGGSVEEALDAAAAVEILHNFTLVHDDIMDNANQRRGRDTVHRKWDGNVAILVGDALVGVSYDLLLRTRQGDIRELARVFTEGIIDVCEGQAYDKEFESLPGITEEQYFMMIARKTGRLVTMSLEMGAIIGSADAGQRAALREYGDAIGRAFQVQDDLLDVIADEKEFGKTIGGDIMEGKKTFLLVHAMSKADGQALDLLKAVASKSGITRKDIPRVQEIYNRSGVLDIARERIRVDTDRAIQAIGQLKDTGTRDMLIWFAEMLLRRNS